MREAGVPVKRIAKHLGRQNSSLRRFIADAGGRRPTRRERSELRLSLEEREEISRGLAAGDSIRVIAEALGRSPSTVCREVNANGGRKKYRALVADRAACRRALRPKRAKLAQCRRLRGVVERKLEANWSPEQISAWLASQFPDRPEMQVSHETIYQSLFVQSRGALRKELHSCLRSGRAFPEGATVPQVEIRLLRSIPIFAALPAPALEGIARELESVSVATGTTMFHEGDQGDRYYAVAAGSLAISRGGVVVKTVSRGEGFGEIALIHDVPRRANVTAITDASLYSLRKDLFVQAVTVHSAASLAVGRIIAGHLGDQAPKGDDWVTPTAQEG
jgi:hypothetical protein